MNPTTRRASQAQQVLAVGQGAYFAITGLWPLVSLRSFEKVTGPKLEGWLVKTVGLMIANVGVALLWAGLKGRVGRELRMLAAGSALSLAAVDVIYAGAHRRISPVYLLDAVVEAALAVAWAATEKASSDVSGRLPLLAGAATAAPA